MSKARSPWVRMAETELMVKAAQDVLGCLNDEMCNKRWKYQHCAECRDSTRTAVLAAMQVKRDLERARRLKKSPPQRRRKQG